MWSKHQPSQDIPKLYQDKNDRKFIYVGIGSLKIKVSSAIFPSNPSKKPMPWDRPFRLKYLGHGVAARHQRRHNGGIWLE